MSREAAQNWLTRKIGITLPYHSMGKVDSLNLFDPNELIIFAFYEHNRDRYKKVLDIGANLGLHSILMHKLGWEVRSFEPDPDIFIKCCKNVYHAQWLAPWVQPKINNAAVSDRDGEASFVRVMDNRTGSHLDGFKDSYGPRESITVPVVDCRPLFHWADLAKLDVEGHEEVLLRCVTDDHLKHLDLICELRGEDQAASVLRHFQDLETPIYTQKTGWKPAQSVLDMPVAHQQGSIFISRRGGPF